ncbi:hypothetical protein JD844_002248, partial [Phrynosoma platyrhinos]
MEETDVLFLVKILEELDNKDMRRLKCCLNTKGYNGKTIPQSKLPDQDMNAEKVADLLMNYYHPEHLEALRHALDAIPKKILVEKVSIKIDAGKLIAIRAFPDEYFPQQKEHGNQTEEVDDAPAEKLKSSERPSYNDLILPFENVYLIPPGEFRLSDMEDYATANQDLLIEDLKKHLEPSAFKKLEEDLASRALKNGFMFTGPEYYTLFINRELQRFLRNVSAGKKSQKIPSKILDILFFPKRKGKREAMDKDKIDSNLLFAQQMTQSKEKKQIPSSSTDEQKPGDERKELPTNKEKGDAQISKEDIFTKNDNRSDVKSKEYLANNEKNIHISTQDTSTEGLDVNCDDEGAGEYPDVDCDEQEPVYEGKKDAVTFTASKKTNKKVPENERYEVLGRAIRKHYKEKRYCFDLICIRQHKKYYCFIAQDVLLFRLEEETEYRILRSLQDFSKLKKNLEFELQFNMAIL